MQEEPLNMGAWNYLSPQLLALVGHQVPVRVIARPERASPASGFMDLFLAEQEQILTQALGSFSKERGGNYAH